MMRSCLLSLSPRARIDFKGPRQKPSKNEESYRNRHAWVAFSSGPAGRAQSTVDRSSRPVGGRTGNAPNERRQIAPVMGRAPVMSTKRRREERATGTNSITWITSEQGVTRSILGPAPDDVRGGRGD